MKTPDSDKKDKLLHLPGQSSQEKIHYIEFKIVGYIFFGVLVGLFAVNEWFTWFMHSPRQPVLWTSLALIAIVYCAYKCRQLLADRKKRELGWRGEIEVGQSLEELRKNGYVIFHDIVAGDFNIDHVVIAPNGIFAVETKKWSKTSDYKMVFNGEQVLITGRKPNPEPIQQARANAKWIHDQLKASTGKFFGVRPVVVFPRWWVTSSKENTDVWVLNPKQLSGKIAQEPSILGQEDMHLIVYFLSRYIKNI